MPSGVFIRKPYTEEHKRNISIAKFGKAIKKSPKSMPMSLDHRKKISLALIGNKYRKGKIPWNKGKKRPPFSIEWINKIREKSLGRVHSMESKKKLSDARRGDKNPFWKGGVSPINRLIRRGLDYRVWREAVFKRDNYTCQICFQKGGTLNADHIKPFALYPDLRFEMSNGRALCVSCHRKTDTYGRKTKSPGEWIRL